MSPKSYVGSAKWVADYEDAIARAELSQAPSRSDEWFPNAPGVVRADVAGGRRFVEFEPGNGSRCVVWAMRVPDDAWISVFAADWLVASQHPVAEAYPLSGTGPLYDTYVLEKFFKRPAHEVSAGDLAGLTIALGLVLRREWALSIGMSEVRVSGGRKDG